LHIKPCMTLSIKFITLVTSKRFLQLFDLFIFVLCNLWVHFWNVKTFQSNSLVRYINHIFFSRIRIAFLVPEDFRIESMIETFYLGIHIYIPCNKALRCLWLLNFHSNFVNCRSCSYMFNLHLLFLRIHN